MQVYLVGGAVRDGLLGLPVKERDWVVVGGTREELERLRLSCGRTRFSGVAASRDSRGVRARATRAQDRARLSRIQRRVRTGSDARGGSLAPRSDGQRDGAIRRRDAHRSVWRRARHRGAHLAACVVGIRRGSGTRAARGAVRRALRTARFSRGPGNARPHARNGRASRSRRARPRARLAGDGEGAARVRRQHLLQGAARLRRARAHLPGNRRAVRRAATDPLASGDRYRRAHADGARSSRTAVRRCAGALRGAGA